jgi:hypothetical protein
MGKCGGIDDNKITPIYYQELPSRNIQAHACPADSDLVHVKLVSWAFIEGQVRTT